MVVFDNAGRTAQLRAAHRSGARVVYISARARQRRKAFRFRWMRLIDEHWIAYPEFIAGSLTAIERLKLRLMGRPTVRYLDVIFSRAPLEDGDRGWHRRSVAISCWWCPAAARGIRAPRMRRRNFSRAAKALAERASRSVYVGPAGAADAGDVCRSSGRSARCRRPSSRP